MSNKIELPTGIVNSEAYKILKNKYPRKNIDKLLANRLWRNENLNCYRRNRLWSNVNSVGNAFIIPCMIYPWCIALSQKWYSYWGILWYLFTIIITICAVDIYTGSSEPKTCDKNSRVIYHIIDELKWGVAHTKSNAMAELVSTFRFIAIIIALNIPQGFVMMAWNGQIKSVLLMRIICVSSVVIPILSWFFVGGFFNTKRNKTGR